MRHLKLFIRTIRKEKIISIITIGGFAISMAVILVLVSFIIGEKNVNTGFPNMDQVYRIKRVPNKPMVPETLRDDIHEKVPGVNKVGLYSIGDALYTKDDKRFFGRFAAANDDFLDIFSFQFIYQTDDPTLEAQDNIILTKSFSDKLYGNENPVGEILQMGNHQATIVGVINDVPQNSSFTFDAITSLKQAVSRSSFGYNNELHNLVKAFIRLDANIDPENASNQISGLLNHWQAYKEDKLLIQPFDEVYFDRPSNDDMEHANLDMIFLLSCITAVILFMTIFNYVNLTISRRYERLSEIGIKKTTGASRKDIFNQFIYESLMVSLLAMVIAVFLSMLFSSFFSVVLDKKIEIFQLFSHPKLVMGGVLAWLFIGFISGLYPALVISGISPIQIISHTGLTRSKNNRAGVVAVQFLVTIVLITALLVINKQIKFVKNKDLGFDQELMVRLDLNGNSRHSWSALKNNLKANPSIKGVSASYGTPFSIYGNSSGKIEDANNKQVENIQDLSIDQDFIETFGLSLLDGRNIEASDTNVCLINEQLLHELEWDDFRGKKIFDSRVIGVVKNFNYLNLKNKIGFLRMMNLDGFPSALNIKMDGNIAQNMDFIEEQFHVVDPGTPISYRFYDDWVQSMYQKQEKQAYAVKLFAILAIIISCLGLVGLAEHVTNKKIKEIGIRKVNGAKITEILALLNKDFIKWVAVSFVIAIPVSWIIMSRWLQNFAYKTSLNWWIFAFAGLLAFAIALLTVSFQSYKAATKNPVEALRHE